MQYRAVGEFLIVKKLPWLKTEIALPDNMLSDQGIVRGKVLSIGNQDDHFEDYNLGIKQSLNINDVILYDSRVGLEINKDEKTGAFTIRFANILAFELEEPESMRKKEVKKETKKKKPRKKKKTGKKRATTFRGRE